MKYHNILSSIIKTENSTTNLLHSLLAYKPFREVIVRLFTCQKFGAEDIDWNDIDTQTFIGDSIPDLALLGEQVSILVEIKTTSWRGLTDNQPKSYLEWLLNNNNSTKKYFVALTPPIYDHNDELKKRIELFNKEHVNNTVHILILNWTDIVNTIYNNDLQLLNQYIFDFCKLLSDWYETPKSKMTFEEAKLIYNHNFVSAISKLIKITEDVISGIEDMGYEVAKSFNKRWWEGEYGGYVKHDGQEILWFGVWQEYWSKHDTPLCFGVHQGKWDAKICNAFQNKYPSSIRFPPGDTTPYQVQSISTEVMLSDDPTSTILDTLEECLKELKTEISA